MNTRIILTLGAVVVTLTSIACSSARETGSDSSNITGDETKKKAATKTPAEKDKPSKTAGADAASATPPSSKGEQCFAKCVGTNAKAKKLHDDDAACFDKCPEDEHTTNASEASAAPGGGTGSGGSSSEAPSSATDACANACSDQYEKACDADRTACKASQDCESTCFEEGSDATSNPIEPGPKSDKTSSSSGDDDR